MAVVDNAVYVDGRRAAAPDTLGHTVESLRSCSGDGASFCWIGMLRPTAEEIAAVAKEFNLHQLAVEDAVDAHQRPKLERYGDTRFVVLRPARYVDPVEVVELGELHLFLGPEFVITVRHADEPDLAVVRQRMEEHPDLLRPGPDAVLYAAMDKVVDDYFPVLDGLQNDIDEIETQVFTGDPEVSRRIYQLTREVIEFQRAVEPLREILDVIRSELRKHNGEHLELRRGFRDVRDHAVRVIERTDSFRQLLNNMLTANATQIAQRQNEEITRLTEATFQQSEQVKRISSWAAVLFAPTLVGTVYGMNFAHMPELTWVYGYPLAVLLMILTGLVLWAMFKRRGWL
ncbi:MAG: magnesium and cobalt transport protein CorA [Actinomycetota bacterium]|nr:magnesium and cobalt transport protein CorA [Actinomycetota bacterium]